MQSENVNQDDFIKKLKDIEPDFIVVVAFGQKLSAELLEIPEYGCINLLPAQPIYHAVHLQSHYLLFEPSADK